MLYGAGGVAILLWIISLLGFSPFLFATTLLGFLITPFGRVVGAIFGAAAVFVLQKLFSQRDKLRPILERLIEAKPLYETIKSKPPNPEDLSRKNHIDWLFQWVLQGGAKPSI